MTSFHEMLSSLKGGPGGRSSSICLLIFVRSSWELCFVLLGCRNILFGNGRPFWSRKQQYTSYNWCCWSFYSKSSLLVYLIKNKFSCINLASYSLFEVNKPSYISNMVKLYYELPGPVKSLNITFWYFNVYHHICISNVGSS